MKNNNRLYKWLIVTFIILYSATAFVSFYHSITFFNIANAVWLSIILSLVAEIGQASVLFSLLLTKNKHSTLAWSIMFLLTALQIVGNVVSSFKYISLANNIDFTYFQKSILFWVSDTNTEMFKIIIAWITGGILPIIALSMTALVADNMKLKEEEPSEEKMEVEPLEDIYDVQDQVEVETDIDKLPEPVETIEKISKPRVSKRKGKKPDIKGKNINLKPVKDLDSVLKKSRGTELIQTMQSDAHKNDVETPIPPIISDQTSPDAQITPTESNILSTTYDSSGNIIDRNYK